MSTGHCSFALLIPVEVQAVGSYGGGWMMWMKMITELLLKAARKQMCQYSL